MKKRIVEIMNDVFDRVTEISESNAEVSRLYHEKMITPDEYDFIIKNYNDLLMNWLTSPTKMEKLGLKALNKLWAPIVWELNNRLTDDEIYVVETTIDNITIRAQANADEPTRLYGFSIKTSYTGTEVSLLKEFLKNHIENSRKAYAFDTLSEYLHNDIEDRLWDVLEDNFSSEKKIDETGEYYMDDVENAGREILIDDCLDKFDELGLHDFGEVVLNECFKGFISLDEKNPYVK